MSVIVKDMMLPDCCAVCELTDSDDDGIYCNVLEKYMRFDELPEGRRSDCPIFDENVKTIQSIVINDRYGNVAEYEKVTRCKDCKYVGTDATCCLVCNREGMGLRPFHVYPDDYCSYAEPKDKKNETES